MATITTKHPHVLSTTQQFPSIRADPHQGRMPESGTIQRMKYRTANWMQHIPELIAGDLRFAVPHKPAWSSTKSEG